MSNPAAPSPSSVCVVAPSGGNGVYTSIATALAGAPPGARIIVRPGAIRRR